MLTGFDKIYQVLHLSAFIYCYLYKNGLLKEHSLKVMIGFEQINEVLKSNNINITGGFHIGAHECEELPWYNKLGLKNDDIVWIDAMPNKIEEAKRRGIPNVYNALITDTDDKQVTFNIANNVQSSSILELCTHLKEHPDVYYVNQATMKSVTIDTFFQRNGIDARKYNFWNFDIQGAELLALKGATESLKYAKAVYLEVNEKELYKNCALIPELDSFLKTFKFKRVLTQMTPHGWGDALYILDEKMNN